jgi:hypothetical protein
MALGIVSLARMPQFITVTPVAGSCLQMAGPPFPEEVNSFWASQAFPWRQGTEQKGTKSPSFRKGSSLPQGAHTLVTCFLDLLKPGGLPSQSALGQGDTQKSQPYLNLLLPTPRCICLAPAKPLSPACTCLSFGHRKNFPPPLFWTLSPGGPED